MKRSLLSLVLLVIAFSTIIIFQNLSPNDGNLEPSSISANDQAMDLYRRLAGTSISVHDPVFKEMVSHINSGNRRRAAELAVQAKDFYHITVRDFAGKMSTREENTLAPLSDFVATVMGVVRDDISATELLTGNFYYRAKGVSGVSDNVVEHIIKSNEHYKQLEAKTDIVLIDALQKEEGQRVLAPSTDGLTATNTEAVLDDAAGLLTTRAYMLAHANAGTNRRLIEYAFKVFQCTPIANWASTSNPDTHVGREVGRFPASDYNNKCKGCHTGMDALRPATAYYDYNVISDTAGTGYIKYKFKYPLDPDEATMVMNVPVPSAEQNVPFKFRRAATAFPEGYIVRNNQWVNYANDTFGWNTPNEGEGMHDLGQMIALSDGFKRCMVKRVFSSVCRYDLSSADSALVQKLADQFKNKDYRLKELFIDVALRPECLGVTGG